MRIHHYLLTTLLLTITALAHAAFTIEPATITLDITRGENSAWLDLVHTGGGPIAVEMSIFERELDIDGELKRDSLKKSSDFIIHPAQIILAPREKARVQVVYKGKQRGAVDRAYLLFSKEVPLQMDDEGEGVRIALNTLMNYYNVLAISTGKPGALTFVSSKKLEDGKVEMIVENKSGGRVIGDRLLITIGSQKIENVVGLKNSVMPGQKRRLVFEFDRAVTAREVRFEYR